MLAGPRSATRHGRRSIGATDRGRPGDAAVTVARGRWAIAAALFAAAGGAGCSSGPSTHDESCSQNTSGLKTCPASAVVQGIDVSVYQGTIRWGSVRAAGVAFGVARISDGITAIDSQFAANWKSMKAAGIVRGSYQYFRASEDPIAQANLALSSLNGAGGLLADDLPVVVDIETADNQAYARVRAQMTIWLGTIARATGRAPIIYTNPATSPVIGSGFADYPLWVANWYASCPTMPDGWSMWSLWQYASTGVVAGISARVDLDEFDGTLGDLLSFAGAGADAASAAAGDSADAGTDRDGRAAISETRSDADSNLPETGSAETPDAGAAMGGRSACGL
jgi:lysozyme